MNNGVLTVTLSNCAKIARFFMEIFTKAIKRILDEAGYSRLSDDGNKGKMPCFKNKDATARAKNT